LCQTGDGEVQAIADEAYRGAYQLITDHRDLLDEIAERLLTNEQIERDEIREIMSAKRDVGERPTEVADAQGSPAQAFAVKPPEAD
jgi:ATP-dependent Zn protease